MTKTKGLEEREKFLAAQLHAFEEWEGDWSRDQHLLWYDNGTGHFDCASSHPTLAAAIEVAGKGWKTHQRITRASGNGNDPADIVWDSRGSK